MTPSEVLKTVEKTIPQHAAVVWMGADNKMYMQHSSMPVPLLAFMGAMFQFEVLKHVAPPPAAAAEKPLVVAPSLVPNS